MYKDYKHSESLDTGFVGGNGLIWMFSGIILGLLVGLGMYYFANNKTPMMSSVDSVQQKIASAQTSARKAFVLKNNGLSNASVEKPVFTKTVASPRHNNFSYYAVLPNLDVPIGSQRPIKTKLNDLTDTTTSAEKVALLDAEDIQQQPMVTRNGDYLLQVASFKRRDRANKTIKRLTQRGITAYIQEKRVKGRRWYRVIAGPVGSNGIDSWKLKAEKLGHRPIVISVR